MRAFVERRRLDSHRRPPVDRGKLARVHLLYENDGREWIGQACSQRIAVESPHGTRHTRRGDGSSRNGILVDEPIHDGVRVFAKESEIDVHSVGRIRPTTTKEGRGVTLTR